MLELDGWMNKMFKQSAEICVICGWNQGIGHLSVVRDQ